MLSEFFAATLAFLSPATPAPLDCVDFHVIDGDTISCAGATARFWWCQ